MAGAGLSLGGMSLCWQRWGVSSSGPLALQLLLLSRLEGDRDSRSESSCMLAREPKSLLKVVVLQFCSGLQEELWWLEVGEKQLQFSTLSAVSMVAPDSTGALCEGAAGLSPNVASVSCVVVEQRWGHDVCAAGAAGACPGSWSAQLVVWGGLWEGLHVSSVRSMMLRLLHGAGSVLVSSQVRSIISCGDRRASAVTDNDAYGGTVAPAKGGKGAHWQQLKKPGGRPCCLAEGMGQPVG